MILFVLMDGDESYCEDFGVYGIFTNEELALEALADLVKSGNYNRGVMPIVKQVQANIRWPGGIRA